MDDRDCQRLAGHAHFAELGLIGGIHVADHLHARAHEQLDHAHRSSHGDGGAILRLVHQASHANIVFHGCGYIHIGPAFGVA